MNEQAGKTERVNHIVNETHAKWLVERRAEVEGKVKWADSDFEYNAAKGNYEDVINATRAAVTDRLYQKIGDQVVSRVEELEASGIPVTFVSREILCQVGAFRLALADLANDRKSLSLRHHAARECRHYARTIGAMSIGHKA